MPRFAILNHDWPFLHWDLLLESEGKLLTWRLLREPAAGATIEAEALPSHRLAYLDYEGPVSGNRGSVTCWDRGELLNLEFSASSCSAIIEGERFCGRVAVSERAASSGFIVVFGPSTANATK